MVCSSYVLATNSAQGNTKQDGEAAAAAFKRKRPATARQQKAF